MTIPEVLRELGIEYKLNNEHHHVSDGWVGIDCPYCSPNSGRFRMGIPMTGRVTSCWTCGAKPIVAALVESARTSGAEVVRLLRDFEPRLKDWPSKRGVYKPPSQHDRPLSRHHRDYLKDRRFDYEEIKSLWGVGGIGQTTRFAWSLFIPIHLNGEAVSWTTRSLSDEGTRYGNARPDEESVSAKELLYGADLARHAVVVCEGPTDAWRLGPGGTALMGLNYTAKQKWMISRFPLRVVCLDNEPKAQTVARRLADELQAFEGETLVVTISTGKDVAGASGREVKALRRFLN